MIGRIIILTIGEMLRAASAGRERTRINRKLGAYDDTLAEGNYKIFIEANGCAAELAHGNMIGQAVDLLRERWGKTPDFIQDGMGVGVKATKYPDGQLLLPERDWEGEEDIFALWTGNYLRSSLFVFRGYCPRELLMRAKNLQNPGKGPCYGVAQSKLMSFEEAAAWVRANRTI